MKFYSHGKLLLTGEYLVLDNAPAIALPTQRGQSLEVEVSKEQSKWKSFDAEGKCWFNFQFDLADVLADRITTKNELELKIVNLLQEMYRMNANCFPSDKYYFTTHLDFNRNWGLGTSSTLVNNLAQFANINPYQLLEKTFGGSGYDIACAQANQPILYQNQNYRPIQIPKVLQDNLYFVYLNQKQNSREAIVDYRNLKRDKTDFINKLNSINKRLLAVKGIDDAIQLFEEHEKMMSELLAQKTVKERLFADFNGAVKSLGAWGGDFVAVLSQDYNSTYFKSKGYKTIFTYKELIKY